MQFVVKNKMIIEQFGISDLALKLHKGSLALFPTDTLPALCSCPKYSKEIWTIKKRPKSKQTKEEHAKKISGIKKIL